MARRFYEELHKKDTIRHDNLVKQCISKEGRKKIALGLGFNEKVVDEGKNWTPIGYKSNYSVEVLCKTETGFIVGYLDLLLRYKVQYEVEGKDKFILNCPVLVEVKPHIESEGSVIRQMKTYYDCLRHKIYANFPHFLSKVIVTYDVYDNESLEIFENEGIKVITFEE